MGELPPCPDANTLDSKLLAWWNSLPEVLVNEREGAHRMVRTASYQFPRSDNQLIEYAVRVGLPQSLR